MAESSDGVIASSIIVIILTSFSLLSGGLLGGSEKCREKIGEEKKPMLEEDKKKEVPMKIEEEKKIDHSGKAENDLAEEKAAKEKAKGKKSEMLEKKTEVQGSMLEYAINAEVPTEVKVEKKVESSNKAEEPVKEKPDLAVKVEDDAAIEEKGEKKPRRLEEEEKAKEAEKVEDIPTITMDKIRKENDSGKSLVLFENTAIDLSAYLAKNPDFVDVLNLHLGHEIGSLVYRENVGDLSDLPKLGKIKDPMLDDLIAEGAEPKKFAEREWRIAEVEGITNNYFALTLKSEGIKFRSLLSMPQHFGKFFTLVNKADGKKRSLVFSGMGQDETIKKFIKMAIAITSKVDYDGELIKRNEIVSNTLDLILAGGAPYSDKLSHSAGTDDRFYLQGPYVYLNKINHIRDVD